VLLEVVELLEADTDVELLEDDVHDVEEEVDVE